MIAIINYGVGNLNSIANMLKKVGRHSVICTDASQLKHAGALILPGVGSFDASMRKFRQTGLVPLLNQRVIEDHIPILGICLGMQMMTHGSEEGTEPGLGWIEARTIRFDDRRADHRLRLPHMGWNRVHLHTDCSLFDTSQDEQRFYFLHSYHVVCDREEDILAMTHYGYPFVSAFQRANITGVQFHPEKSHRYGMYFMREFAKNGSDD